MMKHWWIIGQTHTKYYLASKCNFLIFALFAETKYLWHSLLKQQLAGIQDEWLTQHVHISEPWSEYFFVICDVVYMLSAVLIGLLNTASK